MATCSGPICKTHVLTGTFGSMIPGKVGGCVDEGGLGGGEKGGGEVGDVFLNQCLQEALLMHSEPEASVLC